MVGDVAVTGLPIVFVNVMQGRRGGLSVKQSFFQFFPIPHLNCLHKKPSYKVDISAIFTSSFWALFVENMVSDRALRQIWSQVYGLKTKIFSLRPPPWGGGGGLLEILYICFSQLSFKRWKKFHPG